MRSAGKRNSPLVLLTTVVVTVEPSFLALTRTPSISPSSAEDTLPLRVCAFAPIVVRPASSPAKLTVAKSLLDIISSLPPRIIRQYKFSQVDSCRPPPRRVLAAGGSPIGRRMVRREHRAPQIQRAGSPRIINCYCNLVDREGLGSWGAPDLSRVSSDRTFTSRP